ncbi:protein kinase domain-containing protein [Streptomyces pseudovenezuelae]|uniref:Outer membrane protein assembly factor BamB n=1 Tax=Streptomyces pseudovenezuelae TaxID=67350 RepID=A0ABT6LB31_9ACTN|nr:serine/threonine-protein kinase [Streptomyces pseudovenezuelae]MDH6213504.1 outer membrane protein assembly factor BamB [Streptomyces pseudovenezuelae]
MSLSPGNAESAGASIAGYTLIDQLGSGGMGVVHLGLSESGRQVAIKVVHAQYALDEEFRARFRQEVAAARRVSGAFTAPVVDADPDAAQPWMATLYVPGRTLTEVVADQGPLSGRRLRTLALGLVEALRDIHRAGVVHRDLKPSNVLIAEDGPRVIDFGISRAADNEDLTVTGRLIGTPPFMSPEQFSSPRDVTAASDVFSLGSVLVYAATGNRPFEGGSPYLTGYQVMYEAPKLDGVREPLRAIAARCLEKDPSVRPGLEELHRALLALPADESAESLPDFFDSAPTVADGVTGTGSGHRRGSRPHPGPADHQAATATGTGTGTTVGRRRRVRRVLVGLGSALALTTVGLTAAHVVASDGGGSRDPGGSASPSASVVALPAGWHPWRASLRTDKTGQPLDELESGCVPSGATALYCAGTGFTTVKLDAASGLVKWRRGTSPETSRPIGVRDKRVFAYRKPDSTETYVARRLVALDATTGAELWAHPVTEDEPSRLFDGGILTMDADKTEFIAYDETGRQLWTAPTESKSGPYCTTAVFDGAPYGLCSGDDPTKGTISLLRLNPAHGTAREIAELPANSEALGVVDGQPLLLSPAKEYASAPLGDWPYASLSRVDPDTGAIQRLPLKTGTRGTATLIDGVVYFVRANGSVTAVRGSDGTRLWQRTTDVENLSAPVLSTKSDSLYLANQYGRLLALNPATGAVRWRTASVQDPGDSASETTPYVLLVKDAIVAVAGDTAFSVRPDRPRSVAK